MKANKYFAIVCAALALGLASCSKDQDSPEAVASITVVSTSFDQAYTASTGRILVDQEGFEVKTDASWLKAVKDGAKSIALTIEKNETAESRTANVIITKGETVQRVPITQLGVINIMSLSNIEAQRQGSEHSFAIDQMDSEPTITASHDWITTSIEGKVLKIKVAPFAPGQTDDRQGTVRVVAGLFDRTITVSQTYGVVAYADLLGEYEMSFVPYFGQPRKTITVTLEAKEVNKSFTLKGLAHDLLVLFNPKNAEVSIPTGVQTGGVGIPEGQQLVLVGWGGGIKKADSNEDDWTMQWNTEGTELCHKGSWNKNFDNIVFTFAEAGFSSSKPYLALVTIKKENNGFGDFYKGTYFGETIWTKKKAAAQP